MKVNRPTQSEIAKALSLSQASIVKYKRRGMPMDSVGAAAAWHRTHVKITAHRLPQPAAPAPAPIDTGPAALRVAGLLDLAANALGSGHDIEALTPALRQALRAVPAADRAAILLPFEVMDVLTADVYAALTPHPFADDPGAAMSDDEANEMGRFWYSVAAGEITIQQSDRSRVME